MGDTTKEEIKQSVLKAIKEGNEKKALEFIASLKYVNITYANGYSLLHIASQYGKVDIINALVEKGANVNAKNVLNETPLDEAITYQKVESVKTLLELGAELDLSHRHTLDFIKNHFNLIFDSQEVKKQLSDSKHNEADFIAELTEIQKLYPPSKEVSDTKTEKALDSHSKAK